MIEIVMLNMTWECLFVLMLYSIYCQRFLHMFFSVIL